MTKQGSRKAPFFCVALYPAAAYISSVEPATPQQENMSVPAAQSPTANPSNRKPKTQGAFGKAKPKTLADYFPMPRRLKRQQTFAANALPPEPDQMAEHIADELGWKPKDWKPDAHQS